MRKKSAWPALVLLSAIFLASCNDVISSNPVFPSGGGEVAPETLLGSWRLTKVLGESPARPGTVVITEVGAGLLEVTMQDESQSKKMSVSVGHAGSNLVASVPSEFGGWGILLIQIDSSSGAVRVLAPNQDILKGDIESGVLPGKVELFDTDFGIYLTGSSEILRAYLATKVNLFDDVLIELRRSGS